MRGILTGSVVPGRVGDEAWCGLELCAVADGPFFCGNKFNSNIMDQFSLLGQGPGPIHLLGPVGPILGGVVVTTSGVQLKDGELSGTSNEAELQYLCLVC